MNFLTKSIVLCTLFLMLTISSGSSLDATAQDLYLPECSEIDSDSCFEEVIEMSDCLKVKNSCSVEFMEAVLCSQPERRYLCPGSGRVGNFSWAKLAVIHAEVLYQFGLPSRAEIDEYTDNEDEISDFINHEALEHVICTFDMEKPAPERICKDGSLYDGKNCSKPRLCTSNN